MLPDDSRVEVNLTTKEALESWRDSNPAPIIEVIEGIHVVRDDLLASGSKARGLDFMIGHDPASAHIQEWVYGSSPAHGYAQVSLSDVCSKYGKKAVIFIADRDKSKLHPCQIKGIQLGGDYHWVPNGMLSVTQKRARDYVAQSPETRKLLPIGGSDPYMVAALARVAKGIDISPKFVWTVGSSGTLTRSLQVAWPDAEFHVVSVGHAITQEEAGKAKIHKVPWAFSKPCPKELRPPFPSVPEYDAKAWHLLKEWMYENTARQTINGPVLFWNVGA